MCLVLFRFLPSLGEGRRGWILTATPSIPLIRGKTDEFSFSMLDFFPFWE